MKVIDEGHTFALDSLDATNPWMIPILRFVKRKGSLYPGNKDTQGGVIIQEVLRAIISRLEFLHRQAIELKDYESATEDKACIKGLKEIFLILEKRAARRHGTELDLTDAEYFNIHLLPACKTCGHIKCIKHNKGD